ncbi:MAG: FHA domain-containing protein FhaB/FipA [Mycobacteriales bacterium]
MPEVVYLVIKVSFLALLWVFVLFAALAVRADLFGTRPPRVTAPGAVSGARGRRPPRQSRGGLGAGPARLVVVEGSLTGTTLTLGAGPVTIGRAPDSTLVLTDDYASNRHARLVSRDGQWLVEDLGSTNGTYLDRTKVSTPTPVPVGTPVRIGKTVLELRP